MTRAEFIDTVNEWWELIDFCSDENCEICNDVYSDDDRDSYIDETVQELNPLSACFESSVMALEILLSEDKSLNRMEE